MIRLGELITFAGIITLFFPFGETLSLAGFILIGLGCAPVYPCLIHSTPAYFGADKSQAIIGIQMDFAYIGILIMPPIYGLIANHISASLLPVYLLIILTLMVLMYEKLVYRSQNNRYNE